MRMNLASLHSSCSYSYLTRADLLDAFGKDDAVLIAKDYKNMMVTFECDADDTNINSLLLNGYKDSTIRDLRINGDVLRPVQLKLVNPETKPIADDPNLLICLDDMNSDDEHPEKAKETRTEPARQRKNYGTGRALNLALFRRRMQARKLMDLDESEREAMATTLLAGDRFKDKSLFYFIDDKQLLLPSDYSTPDFLTIDLPPEAEYDGNFSDVAPSVHDLFDIEVPAVPCSDYEMMEYLEDEVDL